MGWKGVSSDTQPEKLNVKEIGRLTDFDCNRLCPSLQRGAENSGASCQAKTAGRQSDSLR